MKTKKIKIGVSSCLLGEKVRWDGDHKQDRHVCDELRRYFDFVPICPEVEVGMSVPREPVHLVLDKDAWRLMGKSTKKDWTGKMTRYSKLKIKDLSGLSGFVFKEGSPSCGISNLPVHSKTGKKLNERGQGLFVKAFKEAYPLVPVADEKQLQDSKFRKNFIDQVFSCHKARISWSILKRQGKKTEARQ